MRKLLIVAVLVGALGIFGTASVAAAPGLHDGSGPGIISAGC